MKTPAAAQGRYKENFDEHVRIVASPADVGDEVFLKREAPLRSENEEVPRSKLQTRADMPFEVIDATSRTVTILCDGLTETVTRGNLSEKTASSLSNMAEGIEYDSSRKRTAKPAG